MRIAPTKSGRLKTPLNKALYCLRFLSIILPVFGVGSINANEQFVPEWAIDATWYQIFPERFHNGDPSNDPPRSSLDFLQYVPESWQLSSWTSDWYARAPWEIESREEFYHHVHRRRYGGDLQGVIDKLDHLQDLGINALYLNPLFYADSMHKYDGNCFHHIDPHFGPDPAGDLKIMATETHDPRTWKWTSADRLFLNLIREAHRRNMRVIIDGVWNHTGTSHFAFQDLVANQQRSRYKDWFKVIRFDSPDTPDNEFDYQGWHGYKSLPEFQQLDGDLASGPKRYVFACTRRWMDPSGRGRPGEGIDGWRLDVAEELPPKFWQDWHKLVRSINPEAYTSAEIWGDATRFVPDNHFSAAMNYHGFAMVAKAWFIDQTIGSAEFLRQFTERFEAHPPKRALAMQNLYDSHDTQRLASAIVNQHLPPTYDDGNIVSPRHNPDYRITAPDDEARAIWAMMAVFQFTAPGAPMVYYGTELGMFGADDPDNRMPAWWPEFQFDPIKTHPNGSPLSAPIPVGYDPDIHHLYRSLGRLRSNNAVFSRGNFKAVPYPFTSSPPPSSNSPPQPKPSDIFAFTRQYQNQHALIVINRSNQSCVAPTRTPHTFITTPPAQAGSIPPKSAAIYLNTSPR